MRQTTRLLFGALLFLALLAIPLAAQDAAVTGTVHDQQQAVIPNASVTLTNLGTGVAQTTKTDLAGAYEFPFVKPGDYALKAEQKGFETFVQQRVSVGVAERVRVDATMRVGESSTMITVETEPAGVQTESSSLGEVVESQRISQMPLNGRFFLDLALLATGTTVPSTNNRTFLAVPSGIGISGINASGTREDSTNYMFDGINLSDMVQNQITFQPNIDMIQEFKVQ